MRVCLCVCDFKPMPAGAHNKHEVKNIFLLFFAQLVELRRTAARPPLSIVIIHDPRPTWFVDGSHEIVVEDFWSSYCHPGSNLKNAPSLYKKTTNKQNEFCLV